MAENEASPLTTRNLLARFLAPEGEDRAYLRKPHRYGGHLYASDAFALVQVPDDPEIEASSDLPADRYASLLAREWAKPGYSPVLMPPLPALPCCSYCAGTGASFECTVCNGVGEIECSLGHYHECEACEGNGRTYTGQGRFVPCPQCRGRKIDCDPSGKSIIAIGVAHAKLSDLHRIADLPGLEVFVLGRDAPLRFRFAHGCGLIMPVRVW